VAGFSEAPPGCAGGMKVVVKDAKKDALAFLEP
jgi:hypothetical protein